MTSALTASQIDDFTTANPEWRLQDGKLVREWTFKNFVAAMAFVNRVAEIAESSGHHPDIDIRYNRVLLGLVSHDVGGVTERDTTTAVRLGAEFAPQ
jgi:4a-hydroxytetrahydrobiopterin dehydratase